MRKLDNTNMPVSALWIIEQSIPDFTSAMCKGHKKPLWDYQVNDSEKLVNRGRRHNKAIKLCNACVHKDACYLWAVDNEMQGVWGGQVLVPEGRIYLRCKICTRPMIRSRYQKPPWGFRNRYSDVSCSNCHMQQVKIDARNKKRVKRRAEDFDRAQRREARLAKKTASSKTS